MERRLVNLILGLFVVVGIGISGTGVSILMEAVRSTEWPQVDGAVTSSETDVDVQPNSGGRGMNTRYIADVVYRYAVAGQRYSSDQLGFVRVWTGDERDAQSVQRRYPVGARVRVSYDPDDPSVAVLQPGVTRSSVVVLGFGIIWCVLVLLVMFIVNKIVFTPRGSSP